MPPWRRGRQERRDRQEDYQEDRQEERQEERKRRRQGTRPKEERKRRRQGTRQRTEDPPVTPPTGNTPAQPHASAPFTPPADCIVAHAATPAQICPIGGGLQYYFIGPGSSQPGPWIQPFSELATLHAGVASVYSGTNPFTGKSVQIHYLPADQKIRISTFYPDNQYDTNKPYNFTVDANNSVSHEAW